MPQHNDVQFVCYDSGSQPPKPTRSKWCCICSNHLSFYNTHPTCGSCYKEATTVSEPPNKKAKIDVAPMAAAPMEAAGPSTPIPAPSTPITHIAVVSADAVPVPAAVLP